MSFRSTFRFALFASVFSCSLAASQTALANKIHMPVSPWSYEVLEPRPSGDVCQLSSTYDDGAALSFIAWNNTLQALKLTLPKAGMDLDKADGVKTLIGFSGNDYYEVSASFEDAHTVLIALGGDQALKVSLYNSPILMFEHGKVRSGFSLAGVQSRLKTFTSCTKPGSRRVSDLHEIQDMDIAAKPVRKVYDVSGGEAISAPMRINPFPSGARPGMIKAQDDFRLAAQGMPLSGKPVPERGVVETTPAPAPEMDQAPVVEMQAAVTADVSPEPKVVELARISDTAEALPKDRGPVRYDLAAKKAGEMQAENMAQAGIDNTVEAMARRPMPASEATLAAIQQTQEFATKKEMAPEDMPGLSEAIPLKAITAAGKQVSPASAPQSIPMQNHAQQGPSGDGIHWRAARVRTSMVRPVQLERQKPDTSMDEKPNFTTRTVPVRAVSAPEETMPEPVMAEVVAVPVLAEPETPMIVKRAMPEVRWRVQSGDSLRKKLAQWSLDQGVELIWDSAREFDVPVGASYAESFEEAVAATLHQFSARRGAERPVGELFVDPDSGKKVLVITTEERSALGF